MQTINIDEAKTHLSRLIEAAAGGEDVVITEGGKPLVRIVPFTQHRPGGLKRAQDSDFPQPDDVLEL